jgi:fatty acid-binding protein DegV
MARTCLVFDTAANISNNQFDDVYVIPLLITEVIDGKIKTYRDGVDIDGKTCLEKLIAGQCLKTAQSIPKDVVDLMDKLSVEYDEVFFIPCPLQISNQYNSMKLICADYKNVHVFKQNMLANFTL